jgi:hypothetical protein
MNPATAAVRFAAWTLPKPMRDRYREQWLADLRDADEAGIQPSEIAFGSLAFAVTLNRPFLAGSRTIDPAEVARRSRLATGLALSAAVPALAQYAYFFVSFDYVQWMNYRAQGTEIVDGWLGAYSWLAPIVAVLIVTVSRGIKAPVRIAVWVLGVVSYLGELQPAIGRAQGSWSSQWSGEHDILWYHAALVVVVGMSVLLWRYLGPLRELVDSSSRNRRLLASSIGGVLILVGTALVTVHAQAIWAVRRPLPFGSPVSENLEMWLNWMYLKTDFEQLMIVILNWFLIAGAVLACLVIATGLLRRASLRIVISMTVFAFFVLMIGYAGMLAFLESLWGVEVATDPIVVLLLIGRAGLVAVVLYAVGGLRVPKSLTRIRKRDDVPRDAELIGG